MVEYVALAACRRYGGRASIDKLAGGPAAALVAASKSAPSGTRVGIAANGGATWASLWKRNLAGDDSKKARTGIDVSPSRTPKETQIIGLIPVYPPPFILSSSP